MFDLIVKAHDVMGHHITTGLQQNASYIPLGPNEVSIHFFFIVVQVSAGRLAKFRRVLHDWCQAHSCAHMVRNVVLTCHVSLPELYSLDPRHQQLAGKFGKRATCLETVLVGK